MTYSMLYTWEGDVWAPQFGDKDHEAVVQEREDTYKRQLGYGYEGDGKYRASHIAIRKFKRVPSQNEVMREAMVIKAPKN